MQEYEKRIAQQMLSTFFGISAKKKQKKKTSVYILTSVLKKVCKRFSSLLRTVSFYSFKIYLSYSDIF